MTEARLHDPAFASLRPLAVATSAGIIFALALSHIPHQVWALAVMGQVLWNAAQVGQLLMCFVLGRRNALAAIATIIALPFAIYAVSLGALVFGILTLVTCAIALRHSTSLSISDGGNAPFYTKFEFLAFICTLLCSLYNYNASKLCFPYWSAIFDNTADATGFTASTEQIAQWFYSAGGIGSQMPSFIEVGRDGTTLGALIFLLIWTVLPALYVLYFIILAKLAKGLPGAKVQIALCVYCIFHFVFLTDLVAYQFGRGLPNPTAEWAHWSERWVWRIAILLPVYQKVVSRSLLNSGQIGKLLHYAVAAWAIWFVAYQVLAYDIVRFIAFVQGDHNPAWHKLFGLGYRQEIGYHGALVLLTLFYAFSLFFLNTKKVSIVSKAGA